ncbi:hypothetical protein M0638_13905 [Roseomonas sp. NAR14]|uniref:Uncharacterized protein n=1 Tax=Roseomonas acroporae TaxID=2937791 RepID=A0A9X1YAR2_9PROT|nr:hypothetical protein [Roseomonas acroporae]MCK8785480.1 hypothetical protein [Roseomonas acroporae]
MNDASDLERLAQDWITLWQTELAALLSDPEAMRRAMAGQEGMQAALAHWLDGAGTAALTLQEAWRRAATAARPADAPDGTAAAWQFPNPFPNPFPGSFPGPFPPAAPAGAPDAPAWPFASLFPGPFPSPKARPGTAGDDSAGAQAGAAPAAAAPRDGDAAATVGDALDRQRLLDRIAELERRVDALAGGAAGGGPDRRRPRQRRPVG